MTKTISWYSQRMHDLLVSDNALQWQREFPNPGRSLTDWMLDNVLHAMDACPSSMRACRPDLCAAWTPPAW